MIKGATINYLTPDFTLKTRIDARKAEWENNQWVFLMFWKFILRMPLVLF